MKLHKEKLIISLYFLALLFSGIGIISITPPWEGFDETAHYSTMRHIAETQTIPLFGEANLDAAVEDYLGPKAYSTLNPPFDEGMTYAKFFQNENAIAAYKALYRSDLGMPVYEQGHTINWQTQHPPLYYLMLAPLVNWTSDLAFVDQMFTLRFASFFIALTGIAFAFSAFRNKALPLQKDPAVIGFLLYPIILPMWFFEFARLGNDALCLLFTGLLAWCLTRAWKDKPDWLYVIASGLVLGLGLLTKAFFIPIGAALAVWMFIRLIKNWRCSQMIDYDFAFKGLIILALAGVLGGGWYLYKLFAFGSLTGSFDSLHLASKGGFVENFLQNGSAYGILRGMVATFVTYVWAGSWSLARLPSVMFLPQLALAALVFLSYFWFLWKKKPEVESQIWLPVWLFTMFGLGMLHHIVISVAINGNGNTPGWYLHILMPWVAPALGFGITMLGKHRLGKSILIAMLSSAVIFIIIVLWSQFALFMGCATKNSAKLYEFTQPIFCLGEFPSLWDNLAVIGHPNLALLGLIGLALCVTLIGWIWLSSRK